MCLREAAMKLHVFRSWCLLLYIDFIMRQRPFLELHRIVREERVASNEATQRSSLEVLSRAMDMACVLYFKRAFCLQRSAALALLLRRHGWPAQMVIGAQIMPFRSHAWCEVHGTVVNDKPYMPEIYQVLERC